MTRENVGYVTRTFSARTRNGFAEQDEFRSSRLVPVYFAMFAVRIDRCRPRSLVRRPRRTRRVSEGVDYAPRSRFGLVFPAAAGRIINGRQAKA
jgi:hypothetical protein